MTPPNRPVLIGFAGVLAVGLSGVPLAAAASPQPSLGARPAAVATHSSSAAAGSRYDTRIRFLSFDHTRRFARNFHVRGQVVATVNGQRGGARGVKVKLYRRLAGARRFHYLDTTHASFSRTPSWEFTTFAKANATYRVVFPGNSRLQPSSGATSVLVYRKIDAKLADGTGHFHGRVRPDYRHRVVHLDKRKCLSCPWRQVRTHHTNRRGHFSFYVRAPRHGVWRWRVATPATKRFIRSYSGVFTTRLS